MKYCKYNYIYPPRPENMISPKELDSWDNNTFFSQPKMDGSCSVLFTNGSETHIMNRHRELLTNFQISKEEINSFLYLGGKENWSVLVGEYMNKSKTDNDKIFNHKLVIFDILVANGEYMVGKTYSDRIEMMDFIYGTKDSEKEFLYKISDNIYRVKSYTSGFKNLYDRWTSSSQAIEGIVLKRKNSKLEIGLSERNNNKSCLKCRRQTKNYKY